MSQVTVIGGGIVGVCSALFLQREGFTVTLVEAGNIGEGTSFGNAGNISPGAVVPYLIPGILSEAPKWLLDDEGPLKVRPGYFFKVLKGQGPAAPLGQMDFVVNGVMIGGFALVAAPADYGLTGIKTFMVSHDGVVYEKDLGPSTLDQFATLDRFNPDRTWRPVVE